MVRTIGRPRLLRRRLLCIPIGVFFGLVLSGAWTTDGFWWPCHRVGRRGRCCPRGGSSSLEELAGLVACWWVVGQFDLYLPGPRREFWRTGRLKAVGADERRCVLRAPRARRTRTRRACCSGALDPPLNERGRAQAAARWRPRSRRGRRPADDRQSPLCRTRETAEAIGAACGVEVEVDDRLVEVDYGVWDGHPFGDAAGRAGAPLADRPALHPRGRREPGRRCGPAWPSCAAELLARAAEAGGRSSR